MNPQDYYNELKNSIDNLPEEDRLNLLEPFFVGMVNAMRLYFSQMGHSDSEIRMSIRQEIDTVKEILAKRQSEIDVDKPETVEVASKVLEPTDDQFDSDTAIELGLFLAEFGVKE